MLKNIKLILILLTCSIALTRTLGADKDYVVSKTVILHNCKNRKLDTAAENLCQQIIIRMGLMAANILPDSTSLNLCMSPETIERAADKLVAMIAANPDKTGTVGTEVTIMVGSILTCN